MEVSVRAKEIYKFIENFNGHPIFIDIMTIDLGDRGTVRFALCELIDVGSVKPVRAKNKFDNIYQVEYHIINNNDPTSESFWK